VKLDLTDGDPSHLEKQPAMGKAVDLDFTITPVSVTDGDFHHFEIAPDSTKDQIKPTAGKVRKIKISAFSIS